MATQKTIGLTEAQNLMRQLKWQAKVTMRGQDLIRVELFHPKQPHTYNVRRDSAKKLLAHCVVVGSESHETAIMEFDFKNEKTPSSV